MNFECWAVSTWAAGSWVVGSWCPGPEPVVSTGGMRYPLRHVDFYDDDALIALMMEFISD